MRALKLALCLTLAAPITAPAERPDAPADCARGERFKQVLADGRDIDPKCSAALEKADHCCRTESLESCGYRDNGFGDRKDLPKDGAQGAALQDAQRTIRQGNRSRAAIAICERKYLHARADCAAITRDLYHSLRLLELDKKPEDPAIRSRAQAHARIIERIESEGKSYLKCIYQEAKDRDAEVEAALKTANASGDGDWSFACKATRQEYHQYAQCTLVDKKAADGEFVSGQQRDGLEVKSVSLRNCTGFPDAQGRLITADHCGQTVDPDKYDLKGRTKHDLLGPSQSVINPDAAVYDPKTPAGEDERGRPFYYLARDESVGSGCELRGSVLGCSPAALKSMQGNLRAELQGVPGAYFDVPSNNLVHGRDVLVTRGPAFYDEHTGAAFVNAYASGGNSGGPVYFPSGSRIGGVVVDRPVVVGPASVATVPLGGDRHEIQGSKRFVGIPIMSRQQVEALYVPQVANGTLLEGAELFRR